MEFKAVAEPMLMSERTAVVARVTWIELMGMSHCTWDSQGLPGTPWSLANANSWRDAVATIVMLQRSDMKTMNTLCGVVVSVGSRYSKG